MCVDKMYLYDQSSGSCCLTAMDFRGHSMEMRFTLFWPLALCVCANATDQTCDPYLPTAKSLSKTFSNDKLRSMGFRYHPGRPLTRQQRLAIACPLTRSRHSEPDAYRDVKRQVKGYELMTNAEYVDQQMTRNRAKVQGYLMKEKEERKRTYIETGKIPISRANKRYRERINRARKGNAGEPLQLRAKGTSKLEVDPLGRSNGDYLQAERQRHLRSQTKRQKVGHAYPVADHADQPGPTTNHDRNSSSSHSSYWDELSDLESGLLSGL